MTVRFRPFFLCPKFLACSPTSAASIKKGYKVGVFSLYCRCHGGLVRIILESRVVSSFHLLFKNFFTSFIYYSLEHFILALHSKPVKQTAYFDAYIDENDP